jgi:glycosyltransferase involved in cell wall biosynthesis
MPVAIIQNFPAHYLHRLFTELYTQRPEFVVLYAAAGVSFRIEPLVLHQDTYPFEVASKKPYGDGSRIRTACFIWSALDDLGPSAVIIAGYAGIETWAAWLWALYRRRPIVLWFESNRFDYKRRAVAEGIKRLFISRCAAAHVYGRSNRDYLVKLGMPPERITLDRAVVDVQLFATPPAERPREERAEFTLLYVGRLSPEKNLGFLLDALADMKRRGPGRSWRLKIAGYGPQKAALEAQSEALGLADQVEFVGPVLQRDLPPLYRSADAFILPSEREPWGLVTLEAMLCRLPVLVSTQCGCAYDVVNASTGWTFSPWDRPKLVQLLETVLSIPSPQLRAMGDAGYEASQKYTATRAAQLVIECVDKGTSKRKLQSVRSGAQS